ncbi:MAG: hypothetical protein ABEK04_00965 [Candidatus Nanohalobium sp.]
MNLNEIEGLDMEKLDRKYRLLDKLSAKHLANLGYYEAIEIRGGSEKRKIGEKKLKKNKKKSLETVESQLEKIMGYKNAKRFLEHLEIVIESGKEDGVLGNTQKMVEEADRYCRKEGMDELLRENLKIFVEFVAFGYRYQIEGGVEEDVEEENSARRKEAKKRMKAVENNDDSGAVSSLVKDFLGI